MKPLIAIGGTGECQDSCRMSYYAASRTSTMAILVATALHSIATGNMLPAFFMRSETDIRELPTICVDSSEFVVSKLKDRGTHQAYGVVTNVQDFMHILRLFVERELDARRGAAAALSGSR